MKRTNLALKITIEILMALFFILTWSVLIILYSLILPISVILLLLKWLKIRFKTILERLKTTWFFVLIVSVGFLTSCIPPNEAFFTPYKVLKGTHYSIPSAVVVIPDNDVSFTFKTNETWDFDYPGEMFISKIGGISYGTNHTNSVRLGVMTVKDGTEQLWYYCYSENINPQANNELKGYIFDLEFNQEYNCEVGWCESGYFVSVNDTTIFIETGFRPTFEPRTFCSPYYGGNPTASHTWTVPIKFDEI